MAKVGLKYLRYGLLREGENGEDTYGPARTLGKAIKADININKNDVKLYADDTLAESDKTFSNGTMSVETSDISQEDNANVLGHSRTEDGELIANTNDQAPYLGFGFYGSKKVNGQLKYRAVFFTKIQFGEPNDNNSTKGETVTFNTETIEATIMTNSKGIWKKEKTFDTEREAMQYIDSKFGTDSTQSEGQESLEEQVQQEETQEPEQQDVQTEEE